MARSRTFVIDVEPGPNAYARPERVAIERKVAFEQGCRNIRRVARRAPELHARCAREFLQAEAVTPPAERIRASAVRAISQIGQDKYRGRIDATVTLSGSCLSQHQVPRRPPP
jgi:hypothetical protein